MANSFQSRGYPKFCRWVASDDDFFMMRIFGSTSARLAMSLQDQIVEQEKALKDADQRAIEDGLDSGTFRNDRQSERAEITAKLLPMVERYRMLPTKQFAFGWLRHPY